MHAFEDDVSVVGRNGKVLLACAAPLLAGVGLACARAGSVAALGVALAWLGVGTLLYGWVRNPLPSLRRVRARVDALGLSLDGRLVLPAGSVRKGWVQPTPRAAPIVHLDGPGAPSHLALVAGDVDRARELLDALAIDPARTSAVYYILARPLGEPRTYAGTASLAALVLALGVLAGQLVAMALAPAVFAVGAILVGVAVPTRLTVGADGLLLQWLGSSRFVSWSTVATMTPVDGGVVLGLEGGHWLTLRTPFDHERYQPERDAMLERLRAARRAHGQGPPRSDEEGTAGLLRRAGGRTGEWIRAMRSMGRATSGYRAPAMPDERLWRVVEDSGADPTARAGAALALAPSLDDTGRERLRVAAQACAEPRLRYALKAAGTDAGARGPEDELASALDAIERDCETDVRSAPP